MRRAIGGWVCAGLLALSALLNGCQAPQDEAEAWQRLAECTEQAKGCAEHAFAGRMEGLDYQLEQTAYGFITDETPTFLAGFLYRAQGGES